MNPIVRLLQWILKAAVFFALLAFALNNQQLVTLHLLFGHQWRAPMTLVVLMAFAIGLVVGVLGMLPGWWIRNRRAARDNRADKTLAAEEGANSPPSHGI